MRKQKKRLRLIDRAGFSELKQFSCARDPKSVKATEMVLQGIVNIWMCKANG